VHKSGFRQLCALPTIGRSINSANDKHYVASNEKNQYNVRRHYPMKRKTLAIAIASGFSLIGSAVAQQSANSSATTASAGSDSTTTITVTARRRAELLQDVPGAVSAFTSATLESAGIPDLA
jgi:outer membrane receptor protein involved in Fe transport